jgi:hypothetical protein
MGAWVTLVGHEGGDPVVGAGASVAGGTVRVAQACSSTAAAQTPNAMKERQVNVALWPSASGDGARLGCTYAFVMELLLLEALFVLFIAIAIVWWTMFSGRPKRMDDTAAPPDDAPGGDGGGDK